MGVDWVKVFSVVLTGLVVVFLALIILILAVSICSKIIQFFDVYMKQRKQQEFTKKIEENKNKIPSGKKPANIPTVEDGIDEETVAAITAAIQMMGASDGVTYEISKIKKKKVRQASGWGKAGIFENTRAF